MKADHPHAEWIAALGQDSDLLEAGVVLTPERVVETRSHNRAADRADLQERVRRGQEKAARKRRLRSEVELKLKEKGLRGVDLRLAVNHALRSGGGCPIDRTPA